MGLPFDLTPPARFTEILLLGMGKSVALPPPALRKYLNEIGIQVDILDTVRKPSLAHLAYQASLLIFIRETRARRTTFSQKRVAALPLHCCLSRRTPGNSDRCSRA